MSLRKFSLISPYRNEFKLNIAQLSAKYKADRVRGTVTAQFGDIPSTGWPADLRYLQEANFGFRIVKNFWVDAGYFLTHIGCESLMPKDNYFSLLSLCGWFEPNYQSGVVLSYEFSDKLSAQFHFVNGYNVLIDNNDKKSAGIQIDFAPSEKLEFIYNNLIGDESPLSDYSSTLRFYNNFIATYKPAEKVALILCTDYCLQTKSRIDDPERSASMYSGFIAVKYKAFKKFSIALRGETYQDKDAILSDRILNADNTFTGLKASGITLAIEYDPVENGYVRLESRYLKTDKNILIFAAGDHTSRTEVSLTSGIEF
jgi:hypothetical protein